MRHPIRLAAAAAALLSLVLASPASALPDGPIGPYLEHQEGVLVLGTPAIANAPSAATTSPEATALRGPNRSASQPPRGLPASPASAPEITKVKMVN